MVTKNPRPPQQLDLGIGNGTARQFDPIPAIQQGAASFAQAHGRTYDTRGLDTLQDDPQRGHAAMQAISRSYAERKPPKPSTIASYEAMRGDISAQFEHMTRPEHEGGLGLTMEVTPHDPYANVHEMADDVKNNKRIKVLSTETTGGHAFFSNEENDKFRAVHDVYGHAATGRGFSRHGEEAAYQAHSQMFSPQAREAVASDLRVANNYLNYGGHMGEQFVDQDQHIPSLPRWTQGTGPLPTKKQKPAKPQGVQGSLF